MKGVRRYILLCLLLCLSLTLGFLWINNKHRRDIPLDLSLVRSAYHRSSGHRLESHSSKSKLPLRSYLDGHEVDHIPPLDQNKGKTFRHDFIWKEVSKKKFNSKKESSSRAANCRMSNCFNWSRCQDVLNNPSAIVKIHIYPTLEEEEAFLQSGHKHNIFKTSHSYRKILNVIESSDHFTLNASEACLFLPRFDTLSRDPKDQFFIKLLNNHFSPLDEGRNHLIFNLFSGTWPDYRELDFAGFDPKMAILVKASCTSNNFRPGFDISLPLFDETHPETSHDYREINPTDESLNKSLLVFKGKRYTLGIGSSARNALHHLHNDKNVLIYTTCRHGKDWEKNRDDRCEQDNAKYDTVDYQELMENSFFCLIPRGRRPDTYRFLESLRMGCIPVLLSNDLVKPFSEVIDWKEIAVQADERLLFQLPHILTNFDLKQIQRMRVKGLAVYNTYFSSVENIVHTVIDIMTDRIRSHAAKSRRDWNRVQTGLSCRDHD